MRYRAPRRHSGHAAKLAATLERARRAESLLEEIREAYSAPSQLFYQGDRMRRVFETVGRVLWSTTWRVGPR